MDEILSMYITIGASKKITQYLKDIKGMLVLFDRFCIREILLISTFLRNAAGILLSETNRDFTVNTERKIFVPGYLPLNRKRSCTALVITSNYLLLNPIRRILGS